MDYAFSGDFLVSRNLLVRQKRFDTKDYAVDGNSTIFPNVQILNRNFKWKFERKVILIFKERFHLNSVVLMVFHKLFSSACLPCQPFSSFGL